MEKRHRYHRRLGLEASLIALIACTKPQSGPAPVASTSTSTSTTAVEPVPSGVVAAIEFGEKDFRGSFNGAKVVATFAAKSKTIDGTLFYESVGTDIPLHGTIADDGAITLSEMKGTTAISTTTLTRAADGTLSGTWKSGDKSGPATLAPVAYKPGDPIVTVARHLDESSLALCGKFADEKPKAPCRRKAKAPVVLGLADRAFEKKLNETLLERAKIPPPANPEGIGVSTDYRIDLAARGVLSVVFVGTYECVGGKDCGVDGYVPNHKWNEMKTLVAAVDVGTIAKSYKDYVDFTKARAVIAPIVASGFKMCVSSGPDDPVDGVTDAVPSEKGLAFAYDNCGNHVHSDAWETIPYAKLSGALKSGTPYEKAWATK